MTLAAGSRLGPYEIPALIGEGGMGVVFQARDPRLDRQVAIKLLAPDLAADRQAQERLCREARAVAAMDHLYICKILEVGEERDAVFRVMEYQLKNDHIFVPLRSEPRFPALMEQLGFDS